MNSLPTGSHACKCELPHHQPKLVVLTGGPGGGKTAILEMARRYFCKHVVLLPEAASIIFGGGFPRLDSAAGRRSAQRAIYRVQRELEEMAVRSRPAVILCDRGTVDGLAYWPGTHRSFFQEFGISPAKELARYASVIHVEIPSSATMYRRDGIRHETMAQARTLDRRIARAWSKHPRQLVVDSQAGFLDKLAYAIELLRNELPACCQTHLHAPATRTKS
jgi:predicted ATPase